MLNKNLLNILCCPKCRGNLIYKEALEELHCLKCLLAYKIKNGIPIMLIEEATKISNIDEKNT